MTKIINTGQNLILPKAARAKKTDKGSEQKPERR
jgi:hypothetical protein